MNPFAVLLLQLAVAMPSTGNETTVDPAERAKLIAPFLDKQVLAILHVDLTRKGSDALLARAMATGQREVDATAYQAEILSVANGLTKAGAKSFYLVWRLDGFPAEPPFVAVPLPEGADTPTIAQAMGNGSLFRNAHFDKLGQVVVGASENTLKRLRTEKPAARPEVAQAFVAAGDASVQLLILPPADLRRVIEETLPVLPAEIGGGPGTVLTQGVIWAALGVDAKPQTSFRLFIQARDATSAKAFQTWAVRAVKALGSQKQASEWAVLAAKFLDKFDLAEQLVVQDDHIMLAPDAKSLESVFGPAVAHLRGGAERTQTMKKMQQLGIAFYLHQDANKMLPAVANFDKQGKPLLSWRVHLLPFLGEEKLYKEFKLDEPWDSAHNKSLIARMPAVYHAPGTKGPGEGKTTYLVPVGEGAVFTGKPQHLRIPHDFTDGTSNTILLLDVDEDHAVIWTKPDDLKYDSKKPREGLKGRYDLDGFVALLADASARLVGKAVSDTTLRAAFTPSGGEVLGSDWGR